MEPLGDERRLTSILAAGIVGCSRFMSADQAGMLFAITHTPDLTHAGEIIRSLVVLTDPERLVWSNN
jgi:hypothetical protein